MSKTRGLTQQIWEMMRNGRLSNHEMRQKTGAYQPNVAIYSIRQNGWIVESETDGTTWYWWISGKLPGYNHALDSYKAIAWPGKTLGQGLPKIKSRRLKNQQQEMKSVMRIKYDKRTHNTDTDCAECGNKDIVIPYRGRKLCSTCLQNEQNENLVSNQRYSQ